MMQMVNGPWNAKSPQPLLTVAQPLTTSFADVGLEIAMGGDNQLGLFITADINAANDIEIRILHKHESGGSKEYREIYLGNPSSNITTINLNDYQIGSDADKLFKINIPTSGTTPFIQMQARMATDGGEDADIDLVYYVTAWGF